MEHVHIVRLESLQEKKKRARDTKRRTEKECESTRGSKRCEGERDCESTRGSRRCEGERDCECTCGTGDRSEDVGLGVGVRMEGVLVAYLGGLS
jgi:hypothetical protein